jgi:arylsulfatase A-like enzyme/Flp pilus assembly protein TadD
MVASRRSLPLAILLVVFVFGVLARIWVGGRKRVQREGGLSVLLITIDTLRADRLGCYGDTRAQTPWIDQLAAQGLRFERAHAHNVVTLASHTNILSGRYPFDHGVRDNDGYRVPPNLETLATILKRQDYRTGAFVSAFPLDSRFGLGRGFDVYDDHLGDTEEAERAFHLEERRGADTVALAKRWLAEGGSSPYFCWIHLYEPHAPYRPPEPFATRFRDDLYRGEVATADAALGPLLEPLLKTGRQGRTLVVLTADHGESLGEHGELTHGIFAYESTLHIPLIVFCPRLFESGIVQEGVRHVDILPTILDSLALPLPQDVPGRSLLPLAAGQALGAVPCYFEALTAVRTRGWAPLYGVLQGPRKYIDLPLRELYDLRQDPSEAHNLAASRPPELEDSLALLGRFRAADRGILPIEENAEVRERLRSLGYLGANVYAPKQRYTEDDDPKRLIWFEHEWADVIDLEKAGDWPRALELCQDLVRRMPRATLALAHLGAIQGVMGDLPGAVATLRKAFEIDPQAPQVLRLLGQFLVESGKVSEAVRLLAPFAKSSAVDPDALTVLGVAMAQGGRREEALALLQAVHERAPADAYCLLNIGTIYLMTKDYAQAEAALNAALALEPHFAKALNAQGVIDADNGHLDKAIERWKQVVTLDPKAYDALFNLGMLLAREGRPDEARPFLQRFASEAPPATYAADIRLIRAWIASRADGLKPKG